jgi:hypothetical protein
MGLTTSPCKNKLVTNCYKGPRTWMDSLDKRLKLWKMGMRLGAWNVRSLYRACSLIAASKEISKCKSDLVGVQEVRWDRSGTEPAGKYTFFLWKEESES